MSVLRIALPLIIIVFIFNKSKGYFQQINWELVAGKIPQMPLLHLFLIILVGLVASAVMIGYDLLLNKKLNLQIPLLKLIKYSWITNSFNNFLGFGGLAGASIRGMLFKKHHSQFKDVVKAIAWSTPLMMSGISFFLLITLFMGIEHFVHVKQVLLVKGASIAIILFLPIYLLLFYFKNKEMVKENRKFIFYTVLTSFSEWFLCFLVFYLVCYVTGIDVPFALLFGLFFVGKFIGIVSMAPGGVGAFDFIIIQGLTQHGIVNENALYALILYRLSYFVIPWIIGCMLTTTEFGTLWIDKLRKGWNLSEKTLSLISHRLLTGLVFLSGALILLSSHNQLAVEKIKLARELMPNYLLNLSLEFSILIGFMLIILSRAVYVKLKASFYLTILMLLAGASMVFTRGFKYEEAFVLMVVAILLLLSKQKFQRKGYALKWEELSVWIITIAAFGVYYVNTVFQAYPFVKKWLVVKHLSHQLLILVVFIAVLIYLFIPKWKKTTLMDEGQEERVKRHFELYKGNINAHLVFLQDKYLYWSINGEVLFMYKTIADKIVVLGEPIGNEEEIDLAIEEFKQKADNYGMTVIFYQIGKENMSRYHEKGYHFFKLGEESMVNLNEFSLSGKRASNLRNQLNKFTKLGFTFEVIQPPYTSEVIKELRDVSNEWLGNRKEKGFSLGFFCEEYLQKSPIAVLRNENQQIVAFANLTPAYDSQTTLSLDLMRYKKDAPIGTMDVLFCRILEWSKSEEYQWFSLRMAPLANVGNSKFSFLSEKTAYKFFTYGSSLYGFSGLKRYKEKFTTNWDAKYMAYRSKSSFLLTMLQVSIMIQNSKKALRKIDKAKKKMV